MNSGTESEDISIENVCLEELEDDEPKGQPLLVGNLDVIKDVRVQLEAKIGDAELTVRELFALEKGAVVKMNQDVVSPVEIRLDGKTVAFGELVVVGDNFGVRISEIKK